MVPTGEFDEAATAPIGRSGGRPGRARTVRRRNQRRAALAKANLRLAELCRVSLETPKESKEKHNTELLPPPGLEDVNMKAGDIVRMGERNKYASEDESRASCEEFDASEHEQGNVLEDCYNIVKEKEVMLTVHLIERLQKQWPLAVIMDAIDQWTELNVFEKEKAEVILMKEETDDGTYSDDISSNSDDEKKHSS